MLRCTMLDEKICQTIEHIIRVKTAAHYNGQTLSGVLINHGEHFKGPPIMGTGSHKVIRPNMVSVCRPKPNAGSIIKPQTASFGLLLRDLEPLLTPDAFYAFMIDLPAVLSQKSCNTTVAVPTILTGKSDNFRPEDFFLAPNPRIISLSRTGLTNNLAGSSLGNT